MRSTVERSGIFLEQPRDITYTYFSHNPNWTTLFLPKKGHSGWLSFEQVFRSLDRLGTYGVPSEVQEKIYPSTRYGHRILSLL